MSDNKNNLMIRIFAGSVCILLGIGLFLDNLGIFEFGKLLSMWWPTAIIIYGLAQIITSPKTYLGSAIIITFGIVFLLNSTGILIFNAFAVLFPAVIFIVGVKMLIGSEFAYRQKNTEGDYTNSTAIFGASDIASNSQNYKGGIVNAIFGGSKINLLDAQIKEKTVYLDMNVAFGGVDIIIPKGWNVVIQCIPIFGGCTNKAETNVSGPTLVLKGFIIFGGAEVKNFDDNK